MLNSKDRFDKHVLRLGAELRVLWDRRYILVPLDEPVQRGWRRFHVLTAKAQNRADKDVLAALREVIGTVRYGKSPEIRKKRGRTRWWRYFEIEQPLRTLTVGEWDQRRLPEEWKPYFRLEERYCYRLWLDRLIFASPYVFELKIEPNWVTEVFVPDPEVEQRIAEIEGWLWRRDAMGRLNRLCGNHHRWRESHRQDLLDKIARRELWQAMRNPSEVDPIAFVERVRISFRRAIFVLSTRRNTVGIAALRAVVARLLCSRSPMQRQRI